MSNQPTPTWSDIDAIAERLGVKLWTRRKWKQRGIIPHRWRLPLIEASDGKLTSKDVAEVSQ